MIPYQQKFNIQNTKLLLYQFKSIWISFCLIRALESNLKIQTKYISWMVFIIYNFNFT